MRTSLGRWRGEAWVSASRDRSTQEAGDAAPLRVYAPRVATVHEHDEAGVRCLTLDNPPLNPLADALLEALTAALDRAEADGVEALVLAGAGDTFVAGADIRRLQALARGESEGAPTPSLDAAPERPRPALGELILRLEDWPAPVVAAIDGFALGGGLELALGCHHRVATAEARLGLPELSLGLIPGAGGTQRLPRLIGLQAALELMLSSRQLEAPEAHTRGLVDELTSRGELLTAAVQAARRLIGAPLRRTRWLADRLETGEAARALALAARAQLTREQQLVRFPAHCLDAALTGALEGAARGLEVERERFQECLKDPAAGAMIYLFFAARVAKKAGVKLRGPEAAPLLRRLLKPPAEAAAWLVSRGASPREVQDELEAFGWSLAPAGSAREPQCGASASLENFLEEMMGAHDASQDAASGASVASSASGALSASSQVNCSVPREEWIARLLYPLVSEACQALADGDAARASDLDLALHLGAGFPRFRGGPLRWAAASEPLVVLTALTRFHQETGAAVFRPSAALEAQAKLGRWFTGE